MGKGLAKRARSQVFQTGANPFSFSFFFFWMERKFSPSRG
jgi:hypothetical protein